MLLLSPSHLPKNSLENTGVCVLGGGAGVVGVCLSTDELSIKDLL